jgi:tetratricopeptide (TPR) repeat protein
MNKIHQFRRRLAKQYHAFDLEEAVKSGEALLREHWNNQTMLTMGYAQDLYNLARVYDEQGDFERAIELYTDSANMLSRHCVGDATAYTNCLNNLAAALYDMGLEGASAHLFGQLVSVKRFYNHEPDEAFADSLYNLANSATDKINEPLARRLHREALAIRRRYNSAQDVMDSLHSLAFLHEVNEEYEKAVPLAETAMQLAQGDDYACACHYLATLYDAWGQYEKALPLYEEVIDITRERVGRAHRSYIEATADRASLLEKLGRPREALALMTEVRILYEGLEETAPYVYAKCLRSIASLHKQLGEYEQAEAVLLRSLKLSRKQNEDLTEDVVHLIRLHLHKGDRDRALEALVYSLMYSDAKGPGLAELLIRLAEAFNPSTDPAPDIIVDAVREMNSRAALAPIINKWRKWEKEPFIPAFVMPPPVGRGRK